MISAPQFFRALADRTRLRIVNLLARGSLCVCDIQRILEQPQSSVSRHLALLKSAGLIVDRRDGMRTFYALTASDSRLTRAVLVAIRAHLAAEGDYRTDLDELTLLRARGECHEEPKGRGPIRRSAPGLAESHPEGSMAEQTVLFACVHNAGRSQMAAALFNALVDPAKAQALSAGTKPGPAVYPEVAEAMREIGIDLSSATPRLLTDELARRVNLLITMGCREECPYVPGVERDDWALPDPKGRPLEGVRVIRDDIRARVAALIEARGWTG